MPSFVKVRVAPKYGFRLKEWKVPSESLTLYSQSSGNPNYLGAASLGWIDFTSAASLKAHTLAENVIALIVTPKITVSGTSATVLANSGYVYNSRNDSTAAGAVDTQQKHQLPPVVEVILVAIDAVSAQRLCVNATPPALVDPLLFQDPSLLDDSGAVPGDLTKLQKSLDQKKIRYIVLRSTVMLRAGRWSDN